MTNIKKKDNQLFKNIVPIDLFWDFLQINFDDKDTHFIINKFLYKKCEYNNNIVKFIEGLKIYYYDSKKKYIERPMNYKFFLTIIRQLCNLHNIEYTMRLVYDKSSYEIEYCVYK